ncbi:Lon protease family protein [Caenispirillum salinarum]|uniref:Lon protease family protein n=1 Tax=Caenispirillum salinarum TaxID=859058 RepID=UPI00384FFE9D
MPLTPLSCDRLYTPCPEDRLGFETTKELPDQDETVGQDRAVEAVDFGIGIRADGFNIFAAGPEGTGKTSLIRHFIGRAAEQQPRPSDWAYVHNFDDPNCPRALRLPGGRARDFQRAMDRLVEDMQAAIPAAFEGDEYRTRRQAIEDEFKERQEKAFGEIQDKARENGVALVRTPQALALAPMKDGEVISPEDFNELPEDERKQRKDTMEHLQEELEQQMRQLPRWEREQREKVRALDEEVTEYAVGHQIDDLKEQWKDCPAVLKHLDRVRSAIVERVEDFLPESEELRQLPSALRQQVGGRKELRLDDYKVNVLVGHENGNGAPVVVEDHPTQPNVIGRIEHQQQYGALVTNFTLIRPGALHRANGGYLVIDARKLLMQPFAYEDLKRALRNKEARIEAPGSAWGIFTTTSLEPEPIPLDLKVVLIGEPMVYYLLSHHDPEFRELFKVQADFDFRMHRTDETVTKLAHLLGTMARRDGLKPLHRSAVARAVEQAARLADDSERLTTHMGSLGDLIREADYWAGKRGAEVVERADVQTAIDAKTYRTDRVREHIQEEIARGTLLVDTEGEKAGQINGLAVLQLGTFAFGRPSRITCRARMGRGEVLDIEREVQTGGALHSKGVMILSGFLAARFGQSGPLSLNASLVFEQSYGLIDGDSASCAELYALLSALAEAPIRQGLAVTGSVNQFGQVQAIGGVNEKVEGFFDVCAARGLTGDQGVLIPATNVKHLMLREDVRQACADGRFHIYAVDTVDEGIEILTGIPAGAPTESGIDGGSEWPTGTINRRVAARLAAWRRRVMELTRAGGGGGNGNGPGGGR